MAIWDVIQKLIDEGTTILLTTQYLEEADKLADQIAVIDHGKVIAYGTADQLKAGIGQERVELIIAAESSFEDAVRVVDGGKVRVNKEERSISLATDGSVREIKRILDAIYTANIEIDSMSVHKPTLDDVFLRLTGHEAATTINP